jgi:CheY-like chemotaxis protein/anti-sigma regulatory factor (Ser/Thr protein kinase)
LNSIIGFTSILLSDRGDPMTDDQRKAMGKVLKNGKHLLQLINDILDFSKIESGRMHVSVESDSVENVVSGAMTTAEHLIRQKGLELKEEMQSNLPMFQTDTLKVKQIVVNLLSNAAKFTDEGSITVRTWFENDMVYVSVKDMGIGIEPQNVGKVFEEFQQIDSSHSRRYKGTGLGLPISRRLARLLGGDIVCESVYGEGATFTLSIPPELPKSTEEKADVLRPAAAIPTAASAPKKEEPKKAEPAKSAAAEPGLAPAVVLSASEKAELEKMKAEREKGAGAPEEGPLATPPEQPNVANGQQKILCIDDEPDVIEILRNYLVPEGYAVFAAYSGAEGIKLAEQVNPNAITLDIMMPQKDGWQVLRELKANPKTRDIPVLIHSMIDNKPLAFSLGALDYLPKPAEPVTVLSLVNKAVKSKDKHVLLIDDDEEYREMLSKVLGEEGFQVDLARSAKEAMEKLKELRPAMILLDIRMPEMDGFEFLRHLRQADQWKSIPVTILSGAELTEKQLEVVNSQMIDYVRKADLTLDSLSHTIKKVL